MDETGTAGEPGAVQDTIERINWTLNRLDTLQARLNSPENGNVTHVALQGSGHVLGAVALGFMAGACIAAVIVCSVWVSTTITDIRDTDKNQDAYINATYQSVPEIRAEFDKIKAAKDKKP